MSEIVFGTPEHVAGLSRKALEEDFQWVNDRRMELEGECERLDTENAKLRELVRDMWRDIPKSESCGWDTDANCCSGSDKCKGECAYWYRMRELGIEVDG